MEGLTPLDLLLAPVLPSSVLAVTTLVFMCIAFGLTWSMLQRLHRYRSGRDIGWRASATVKIGRLGLTLYLLAALDVALHLMSEGPYVSPHLALLWMATALTQIRAYASARALEADGPVIPLSSVRECERIAFEKCRELILAGEDPAKLESPYKLEAPAMNPGNPAGC